MTWCPHDGTQTVFTAGALEVKAARLDVKEDQLDSLAARLCDAERRRAARFRFERDRKRFIVARARLRQQLAARLGARPESVELVYAPNGKPALARPYAQSGWRFNVSHCDDLAVYAFAVGPEVGIDVEAIRPVHEADAIAARFFSPRENEAYRRLAPQHKALGFLSCWTRKEAVVKALGEGLRMPLDRFDAAALPCGWRLDSFSPLPGFVAAVASHQP